MKLFIFACNVCMYDWIMTDEPTYVHCVGIGASYAFEHLPFTTGLIRSSGYLSTRLLLVSRHIFSVFTLRIDGCSAFYTVVVDQGHDYPICSLSLGS